MNDFQKALLVLHVISMQELRNTIEENGRLEEENKRIKEHNERFKRWSEQVY